jgi:hypothetical protein
MVHPGIIVECRGIAAKLFTSSPYNFAHMLWSTKSLPLDTLLRPKTHLHCLDDSWGHLYKLFRAIHYRGVCCRHLLGLLLSRDIGSLRHSPSPSSPFPFEGKYDPLIDMQWRNNCIKILALQIRNRGCSKDTVKRGGKHWLVETHHLTSPSGASGKSYNLNFPAQPMPWPSAGSMAWMHGLAGQGHETQRVPRGEGSLDAVLAL